MQARHLRLTRGCGLPAAALVLVAAEAVVRVAVGGPYRGATFVLLAACGVAFVPLLPAATGSLSVRVALVPLTALGIFSILLTTVAIVGIPLTETSIRVAVSLLVAALAAACVVVRPARLPTGVEARREALALAALAAIVAVSFASALVVLRPFPPPGSDWGNYLLYADEVAVQRHLLIDNPYALGEARLFGNYPGIGALYGSLRILDGVSSESLAVGLAAVSALAPVAVYVCVATLWGAFVGLVAAAAYAVAPIRLEPIYWHGLATTFGLLFVPLVVLTLALMYRGDRSRRTIGLLGLALASVLVAHSVSAVVVGLLVVAVVLADATWGAATAVRAPDSRAALRRWWREGMTRPVTAGAVVGALIGAGVLVHMRRQAADLGPALGYEFFGPASVGLQTLADYYTWSFLALAAGGVLVAAASPRTRRDPALAAFAALALAAVLVTQLWRVHVAFDYRRAVYYVALPLVAAIGLAIRTPRRPWFALAAVALGLVYVGHLSIGLRLPQRLVSPTREAPPATEGMRTLARMLDREAPGGTLLVTDTCLGAQVPYLVRRPTLIAGAEWQVGFERLLPPARTAAAVLAGGPDGRRLASRLGVDYVLVDPACTPDAAGRLGGQVVLRRPGLVIVRPGAQRAGAR